MGAMMAMMAEQDCELSDKDEPSYPPSTTEYNVYKLITASLNTTNYPVCDAMKHDLFLIKMYTALFGTVQIVQCTICNMRLFVFSM